MTLGASTLSTLSTLGTVTTTLGDITTSAASVELDCDNVTEVPTNDVYYATMPQEIKIAFSIALICGVLTLLFSGVHALLIMRNYRTLWFKNADMIWLLTLWPVLTVINIIALTVPSSHRVCTYFGDLYVAHISWRMYRMIVNEYGGAKQLVASYHGKPWNFRAPPLCCCCVCLPEPTLTEKQVVKREYVLMITGLVSFANMAVGLLLIILEVPFDDDIFGERFHEEGVVFLLTNPSFYNAVVITSVTITNIWITLTLLRLTFKESRERGIIGKFAVTQFSGWLCANQISVVGFTRHSPFFQCRVNMPSDSVFTEKFTMILLCELLVAVVLARIAFRSHFRLAATKGSAQVDLSDDGSSSYDGDGNEINAVRSDFSDMNGEGKPLLSAPHLPPISRTAEPPLYQPL